MTATIGLCGSCRAGLGLGLERNLCPDRQTFAGPPGAPASGERGGDQQPTPVFPIGAGLRALGRQVPVALAGDADRDGAREERTGDGDGGAAAVFQGVRRELGGDRLEVVRDARGQAP